MQLTPETCRKEQLLPGPPTERVFDRDESGSVTVDVRKTLDEENVDNDKLYQHKLEGSEVRKLQENQALKEAFQEANTFDNLLMQKTLAKGQVRGSSRGGGSSAAASSSAAAAGARVMTARMVFAGHQEAHPGRDRVRQARHHAARERGCQAGQRRLHAQAQRRGSGQRRGERREVRETAGEHREGHLHHPKGALWPVSTWRPRLPYIYLPILQLYVHALYRHAGMK